MSVKPISPNDVILAKEKLIPDVIFEVFNRLIAERFNGSYATVKQDELVDILVKEKELDKREIFDKHWLDVEDIYRQAGWKVNYESPAYNEEGISYFTFSKK